MRSQTHEPKVVAETEQKRNAVKVKSGKEIRESLERRMNMRKKKAKATKSTTEYRQKKIKQTQVL